MVSLLPFSCYLYKVYMSDYEEFSGGSSGPKYRKKRSISVTAGLKKEVMNIQG